MAAALPSVAKLARVTKLSLNNAALPELPEQLFSATELRELDCFRAIEWRARGSTLPARIGELDKLEQLSLGGNAFRELPRELGKLGRLRSLALDHCSLLRTLPSTLGKLTELRELRLSYTVKLRELPREIGRLGKLETLVLDRSGVKAIPPALWSCKQLKVLSLSNGVKKLPPGIAKLRELERLSLSPAALRSIADELPKLTSLVHVAMHVTGKARRLPESLGELANLKELQATFLGLGSLPTSLVGHPRLEQLDVTGNQLTTLVELVRSLPRLRKLGYAENPLPLAEKRELQALMKLPPSKRSKAKLQPAAASKISKPKSLGTVASINAYLALLLVDHKLGKAWTGIGDGPEPAGDWARACEALGDRREIVSLEVGTGRGSVLVLGVWQGVAHVFRIGERITFAEVFADDHEDPLLLEWIAAEPSKRAKQVATIEIESGKLAMLPTTHTLADDDGDALIVTLARGDWSLLVEPPVEDAWGSGRRAHLLPLEP